MNPAWLRIPAELRALPQWVIAAPDKTPLSVDANGTLYACSSVAPQEWLPFEQAASIAFQKGFGIGFMLSPDDPYCCIDFDVIDGESQARKGQPIDQSKWTHPDMYAWIWNIATNWYSYVETSVYGKGLHIWVKAKLKKGYRRENLEVYTQGRYIICTGNAVLLHPIADRQASVEAFVNKYLQPVERKDAVKLEEIEPTEPDEVIWQRAREAHNSANFIALCQGKWADLRYPSQSEADLALMSMFTFYSKSNSQCKRMFRQTALGQREKAQKNDRYLNLTLVQVRTRQANEASVDFSAMIQQDNLKKQLAGTNNAQVDFSGLIAKMAATQYEQFIPRTPEPPPPAVAAAAAAPVLPATAAAGQEGLPWPPGFMGDLARFIYDSAPRPVKEVAIVGALGMMAGIAGKGWHIPGSGLNMYCILVAQSAIGKEAMHSGISTLIKSVGAQNPTAYKFVVFDDFASGQALTKVCANFSSFVNVCGEWGHKLRRIGDDRDQSMASLRRVMTDLYQKSGPQAIVGGIRYSAEEKNIEQVSGVAYSMIGETTPKTFYGALTESMMEDGFLSRFIIIEYKGERPPLNDRQRKEPIAGMTQYIASMMTTAMQLMNRPSGGIMVNPTEEAYSVIQAFEKECDGHINGTQDEAKRQMWNRASLKVMRMSALMAVADNFTHPVINLQHVEWALKVIRSDIDSMSKKLEDGDIGLSDHTRESKMLSIISNYLKSAPSSGYKVPAGMRQAMIVPSQYLLAKCQRLNSFMAHKLGSTVAVRETIRSLCDSGYIEEMNKAQTAERFKFNGKSYKILNLPDQMQA